MTTAAILVAIVLLTLAGDALIKMATASAAGLGSPLFFAGAFLYALPAVGWYLLMKSHSLALVGVLYSAMTLILLAALGAVMFREPFGLREAAGITLAIAAVAVMGW